jgi:hypothetical protein
MTIQVEILDQGLLCRYQILKFDVLQALSQILLKSSWIKDVIHQVLGQLTVVEDLIPLEASHILDIQGIEPGHCISCHLRRGELVESKVHTELFDDEDHKLLSLTLNCCLFESPFEYT